MRKTSLSLILAAALLATAVPTVFAGEDAPQPPDQQISRDFGPGRHGGRHRGPGRDDRDGREGRHRQDWRDGRDRGPGCPGMMGMGMKHGMGPGMHRGMGPGMDMGMGPGMGMDRGFMGGFGPGRGLWRDIELDATQKSKLVDVMTENFRAGLTARMEMMDAQRKVWELKQDENASPEAIIAANQALGAAKGKMEVVRRQAKDSFKQVLTPEQLQKLEERRDNPSARPDGKPAPRPQRDDRDGPRHPRR